MVLPLLAGGVKDFENVDGLGGAATLALGHVQQLGDDVRHALDLFEAGASFCAHLFLGGDEFDLFQSHRQRGERGAQLVGGIGGRLAFRGQSSGHALAGARKFLGDQVDLFDARFFNAGAHAAGADLLSLCGQVDEGRGQGTRERASHEQADQHRADHASTEHAARPQDAGGRARG